MHTHDNDTLSLGFRLKLVHRLLAREMRRQMDEAGPEASARRDEIIAGVQERIATAVPEEDYEALLRSLDAIAHELGWDESQPMPSRAGRDHRHGRGPFGRGFGRGFGGRLPHPGFAHGEHGRFGHHERRGFAPHPAVAEAFERGFTRGYEQAQRD